MNRRDREGAAEAAKAARLARPPVTAAALCEASLQHFHAGRLMDAQGSAQQALAIDPGHAESLHVMGLVSLQMRQYEPAVEWLARAIRQDPKPGYLSSLGFTLKQMGRPDDALSVFEKAIQLSPADAELWRQLGGVLIALNRSDEALLSYQQALKLNPNHWEAALQGGLLLHRQERFEEALQHFDMSLATHPDHAATLQQRARAFRGLRRYDDCVADLKRAHALDPADPITCNNLGDALMLLGRDDEAVPWFDKALSLRPDFIDVLFNKGLALLQLHRFNEARNVYSRLIELDPDNAKAAWQLAHLDLLLGDFAAGWAGRETRWNMPDFAAEYPRYSQPKWLGQQDVAGKTILIQEDEGLGDTIQFARYVPMVAARGAKVILVVRDALRPLLAGIPGVSECLALSAQPTPGFDIHCPVTSLPLAFGTTLDTVPQANYLPPLPADRIKAWEDRLGPHDRLRVGLVWSGNPKQGNDGKRSMPLRTLLPLLDLDADFVSLQKDPRPNDQVLLRQRNDIRDVSAELTDFVETAALMCCLDVVVTVCTSVAHLAATLGRPTWVMLPYLPDWRWLLERGDSPWYSTARLFRQDETRDYAPVVQSVRAELAKLIAGFAPTQS